MLKIAVLISGGGSNLQSVIDEIDNGNLNCKIEMVISSKADVFGLDRAKAKGISTYTITKKEFGNETSKEILKLVRRKVDLIVLAGYLSILDGEILKEFKDKIINIHPSLIPAFSGPGMYGIRVHEAVIKKGVKYSGCTVHFVNEEVDGGEILLQQSVPVYFEDTPEILQKRILVEEHKLLPMAIKLISEEKIEFINGKVKTI
ncbi:MAG: phosphoribosylglycinamide formyltransferase [Clostridium sp.]